MSAKNQNIENKSLPTSEVEDKAKPAPKPEPKALPDDLVGFIVGYPVKMSTLGVEDDDDDAEVGKQYDVASHIGKSLARQGVGRLAQ